MVSKHLVNMSLRVKLFGIALLSALVTAVVAFVSYKSLDGVGNQFEVVSNDTIPKLELLAEMNREFLSIRISLRSLGLPALSEVQLKGFTAETNKHINKFEELQTAYLKLTFDPKYDGYNEKLKSQWLKFKDVGARALKHIQEGDTQSAHAIFLKDCPETAELFNAMLIEINNLLEADTEVQQKAVASTTASANFWSILIGALGTVLALFFGLLYSAKLSKDLSRITDGVSQSAQESSATSQQLSGASQTMAELTSESAASLQHTVASMTEFDSMVKVNSKNALQASQLSQESLSMADHGVETATLLTQSISELLASSKKIEDITLLIDDISFQTNLLALNAAVEAARAGEQGKGFAVVADAVRSLAQKSAASAKEISELIKTTANKTQLSAEMAQKSGESLQTISLQVKKVSDLNREIAQACEEQSNGISQINKALQNIDSASLKNASISGEVANRSKELLHQSELLLKASSELLVMTKGTQVPANTYNNIAS